VTGTRFICWRRSRGGESAGGFVSVSDSVSDSDNDNDNDNDYDDDNDSVDEKKTARGDELIGVNFTSNGFVDPG
jgi:hypothetical protein